MMPAKKTKSACRCTPPGHDRDCPRFGASTLERAQAKELERLPSTELERFRSIASATVDAMRAHRQLSDLGAGERFPVHGNPHVIALLELVNEAPLAALRCMAECECDSVDDAAALTTARDWLERLYVLLESAEPRSSGEG